MNLIEAKRLEDSNLTAKQITKAYLKIKRNLIRLKENDSENQSRLSILLRKPWKDVLSIQLIEIVHELIEQNKRNKQQQKHLDITPIIEILSRQVKKTSKLSFFICLVLDTNDYLSIFSLFDQQPMEQIQLLSDLIQFVLNSHWHQFNPHIRKKLKIILNCFFTSLNRYSSTLNPDDVKYLLDFANEHKIKLTRSSVRALLCYFLDTFDSWLQHYMHYLSQLQIILLLAQCRQHKVILTSDFKIALSSQIANWEAFGPYNLAQLTPKRVGYFIDVIVMTDSTLKESFKLGLARYIVALADHDISQHFILSFLQHKSTKLIPGLCQQILAQIEQRPKAAQPQAQDIFELGLERANMTVCKTEN